MSIFPASVSLPPGGTQAFTATVTGFSNTAVTWSVVEGAAGGSVTSVGFFSASQSPGTYHVVATSVADATATATANVSVISNTVGAFTSPGNMTAARAGHTATLLADGRVLIAGGSEYKGYSPIPGASAELYNPSTGTFTATGDMTEPRTWHTATLLPDGRVLIAGGSGSCSAELYDPSTGTFTAAGDMTAIYCSHTATLLANGKVLIVGDHAAELYDPATGVFAATGPYDKKAVSATLLPDGRVVVYGVGVPYATEIYEPGTGTFSVTGSHLPIELDDFSATLLLEGKILVAGGDNGLEEFASTALYDPAPGSFSATGNMAEARSFHTATLLPYGTVLVAGGEGWSCPISYWVSDSFGSCEFTGSLSSAELYDPSTGTFAAAGNMTARRSDHTATLLKDGRVLITGGVYYGGIGSFFGSLASAELYSPPSLVAAPVLSSLSGNGQGQGAILHSATHQMASSSDPAGIGETLEVYCTGLGDGSSVIPPQVVIGGRMAEVLSFGPAPGIVALSQLNVRVPSGVAPGPAVPVRLMYLGRPSNEVMIGVR